MTYNQYFALSDLYKSLGHPLPEDIETYKKELAKMGALDLSEENVRKKIPEQIWRNAVLFNIHLFANDLEYIENIIKTDKIFKLMNFEFVSGLDKNDISIKIMLCYERFYNDKNCPKQLKKILDVLIGTSKECIPKDAQFLRSRLLELWFDCVR
jgi:hypothetical protein